MNAANAGLNGPGHLPPTVQYQNNPGLGQVHNQAMFEKMSTKANYEFDERRNAKYSYLTEGITNDRESIFGKQSVKQKKNVAVVSEMLFEQQESFSVKGGAKTSADFLSEWQAERVRKDFLEAHGGAGSDLIRLFEDTHGPLAGDSNAITAGAWTTLALGLVRRIYPKLLAFELFSVQPMRMPTWAIFYQKFTRGLEEAGATGAGLGTNLHDKADFDDTFADRTGEGKEPSQINFDLEKVEVTAVSKALKAVMSEEAIQDLQAYWKLNLSSEMLGRMADEILREIDKQLLSAARNGATAGDVIWNPTPPAGSDVVNSKAHAKTLWEAIIDAKSAIANKIYRHPGWLVGGINDVARLEKLEEFKIAQGVDFTELQGQRHFVGTLQGIFKVYVDPWWMYEGEFLVGYKGSDLSETGLVYAPYVPLYVGPEIHTTSLHRERSVLSRYAVKVVEGGCFSRIIIQDS